MSRDVQTMPCTPLRRSYDATQSRDEVRMELRVDFQSQAEWRDWTSRNSSKFSDWKARIVASIRARGFIEPVTGDRAPADEITINQNNLHESVSYNELNSRKRALLLEFASLQRRFPAFARRDARIFAAEALSRTALVLRGTYPFFLGTEYMPDPERQRKYFPVRHADLLNLDMPDGAFDVAMTGDVLEHVSDLSCCLRQIVRVLRPTGWLISTFPFATNNATTTIAARVKDGAVVHLRAPEYHGDPLDPTGALVFQVPGWDILDMCRAAGFTEARMVLRASATHGVVSDTTPGVLVLSAYKGRDAGAWPSCPWIWNSDSVQTVVGILGLPRSGTTVFTAVLDAHKDVVSIYEPWNANKNNVTKGLVIDTDWLLTEAGKLDSSASTLVIKETALDRAYGENLSAVLSDAVPPISHHLLILLRNPFHCFLSEIEARKTWWGEQHLEASLATFDRWSERSIDAFRRMARLATLHSSSYVFYEACVSEPQQTFAAVMRTMGLQFGEQQIQVTKNADLSRIRGDISMVENARDVGDASVAKRQC
jgi:SAM-dependent methyltransferase